MRAWPTRGVSGGPCGGSYALLVGLVRNLVDNAIRYRSSHATVNVTVSRQAGRVRLTVDDSGPGISGPDRPCESARSHGEDSSLDGLRG